MSAADHPGEGAGLYSAVKAIGEELCPELNLTIPVGKDSMSMKTKWKENDKSKEVTKIFCIVTKDLETGEIVTYTQEE